MFSSKCSLVYEDILPVPLPTVPAFSAEGGASPAFALSIVMLALEWMLPVDVLGLGEAEAFLFLDGLVSAILLRRQISIHMAQCHAQQKDTKTMRQSRFH
jgi:hypothetical protein